MKGRRVHALALAPAFIATLALLWLTHSFVTDDSAITLRYSKMLAAGHGIRWNVGQDPVEGYTNFAHVLIGAAAIKLGLPALVILRLLNQLSLFALSGIVYVLGLRMFEKTGWAAAAALFVGAHGPLVYWATSGLETGIYVASVYATVLAVLVAKPGAWWPALLGLLVALTRFEGLVVVLVIAGSLVLLAWRARDTRILKEHGRWLLLFTFTYGAYFAWRWSYFGYLLSNSAYYKQSDTRPVLLTDFLGECWPVFVVAWFAPWRRLGWIAWLLGGVVLAYFVGFSRVGRSVSYMHRFLLPTLPALALLAVAALQRAWNAYGHLPTRRALVWAAVIFVFGFDWFGPGSGIAAVGDRLERYGDRILSRSRMAAFIAENFSPTCTIAVGDVGVLSYVLPNPIIDLFGLNDERYTHRLRRASRAYARVVLADRPDLILLVSTSLTTMVPHYDPDAIMASQRLFEKRYVWVHKVEAEAPDYNFWLFARRDRTDIEALRNAKSPDIEDEASHAAMIDHLAQRVGARANRVEKSH